MDKAATYLAEFRPVEGVNVLRATMAGEVVHLGVLGSPVLKTYVLEFVGIEERDVFDADEESLMENIEHVLSRSPE